jgi:hypothetical protein
VNVSFNPLAEQELNDATRYYELESPGLGAAFLTEVQRCCDAIVEGGALVVFGQNDSGCFRCREGLPAAGGVDEMVSVPKFKHVTDVVAEDYWSYTTREGAPRTSRVTIGRPTPWPSDHQGDWLCPLEIEHFTEGIRAIAGVGPVDALMNAIGMVKAFAEEIEPFTPLAHATLAGQPAAQWSEPARRPASRPANRKRKSRR